MGIQALTCTFQGYSDVLPVALLLCPLDCYDLIQHTLYKVRSKYVHFDDVWMLDGTDHYGCFIFIFLFFFFVLRLFYPIQWIHVSGAMK